MKVLHVTARLSEGGAAAVARNLADTLRSEGVDSSFLYGYGSGGRPSQKESSYETVRIGSPTVAAVQLASHRLLGTELPIGRSGGLAQARQSIASSDLVHVHVPHSYFLNLTWFARTLVEFQKPFVWTLHDQWTFTGRCAQPAGCRRWLSGCGNCPALGAYPPAVLDHSGRMHESRRANLAMLTESLKHQWIACADWLREEFELSGVGHAKTIQNSVDSEFWTVATSGNQDWSTRLGVAGRPLRLIFMIRDLRDSAKVDWPLLERLGSSQGVQLTIVGDNATRMVPGATHLPAMTDRGSIVRALQDNDALVFTSQVDYYPLTIIEALVAGTKVLAVRSPASEEVAHFDGVHIFQAGDDISPLLDLLRVAPRPSAPIYFAPQRMAEAYLSAYQSVLT